MSLPEKPAFMGSKGYGKLQWPTYTSRMQRDAYNRTLSRGLTQEEVHWYIIRGAWKNGEIVSEPPSLPVAVALS